MKLRFNDTLKLWIRRMSWDTSSKSLRRHRIRSGAFSALEILEYRQLLTQTISMVSDINAVSTDFRPENFILVGNTTFFTATTPDSGTELWKTDGTTAGTVLVKDIWPGKVSSAPKSLTNVNGTLYFSATTQENGTELWKSNGTVDGTRLVADISSKTSSSSPQQLVNFQGSLFFSANNGSEGRELWTTKGLTNGATRFAGISRGTASNPDKLTVVGSTLYFVAEDRTTGTELWKTNGVSGSRVRDIRPGTPSSMPDLLTNVAGKLYFVADNGTDGRQIWTTNGTDPGTSAVTGTQTGLSRPSPQQLTAVGTRLFFTADGTSNGSSVGRELWKTDGTLASTSLVRDIRQGNNSSSPNSLVNVSGQLYFSANNGVTGTELWKTNGSTLATAPIADIRANGDSNPQSLTNVNGTLFFAADDGSLATKLWKVNSAGATQVVKTIVTRKDSLRSLTNINGVLYFSAPGATSRFSTNSSEFWRSNGTDPGTTRVRNASGGSNPGAFIRGGFGGGDRSFFVDEYVHANVNGILYFVANDGVRGNELWKTDGTAAGTKLVLDINQVSTDLQKTTHDADPRELTNVGGKLYFTAYNGASSGARSLWVIDSATSIPRRVEPSMGQTMNAPAELVSFGGKLFYSASGLSTQGRELWQSDGTTAGTKMVKDLNSDGSSSSPTELTVAGNTLFFRADGGNGFTLWKSNGTPSGTVPVVSDRALNPMLLTAGGTKMYFLSNDQLWVSDGTETMQLTNNDVSESRMAFMDGFLYFHGSDQNGFELWKTNGTHDGTKMVKDINPLQGHSFIAEMTVVNHTLFFRAGKLGDGSEELWKSDGTTNGTQQVLDIRPGNASSYPQQLLNGNGILYFVANDGTHGGELWRSDGTASGTSMIKDFIPGPGAPGKYESGSNRPRILTNIGSKIFFSATDGVSGHELYSLSGTVAVAPVLTSPGATTTSQVPRFQWNSVTGAVSYDLWFQNLSTGIITQKTGLTTTSYTPPAALGIGRYVVQLRTKISNNEFSPWSPRFEFRINTSVTLTSMSPQQTTARPKVAWTALPGAVKYDLWLDNISTGQSEFVRKVDITSTSWTHTSNLPAGRYQVWVRGIDKAGIAALWSTPIDFEVVLQSASSVATTGKSGPVLAHAEATFPLSLPESESFSYRTELPLGSEWAEIDEVMASLWE